MDTNSRPIPARPTPVGLLHPPTFPLYTSIRRRTTHMRCESDRIPCLHIHRSRPRELAYETLTGRHARYDSTRCNALEDVLTVPGDEVAVVDDVALAFYQLRILLAGLSLKGDERETHVFSDDSPKTAEPQNPLSPKPIHKHALPRKHGLTKPLILKLLTDPLRRR